MIIKQSATNQLHFNPGIDLREYELLTFSFYQNGMCVAKYLSTDKEYVKLNPDYTVDIYMLASVAKKFGPQRVSFEICTWEGDDFELLVSETMDVEICRSNERTSIVDTDDSEITDPRIRAEIERIAAKYIPKTVDTRIDELEDYVENGMEENVSKWLDDHPEATTTVEDGSITVSKLHEDVASQLYPSVAHYGIKASTVDCGAVINNLLNSGVTVFRFLKGTYTFTTPITADIKNCLFIGESGTVLKNNTGGYLVTSAKISRTTFSNFTVDGGSGFNMINTSTDGYYYAYVHFDKVMFTNVETAITYGGKGGYIYVDKCIIRANEVGIIIGDTNVYTTENFYVRDCQIGGVTDGTATGIEVHSGQNIYITGNDFPKLDTAIKVFNDIERPVSYLQIENNNIYAFTTNGILFHPTISASTAYIRWGTVHRNVFFSVGNLVAISNDTNIPVRNYSLSDNMFTLTNSSALAVNGLFATSYWNGGNSCNGSDWFNRLGSSFKPSFDGSLPHYRTSVPATGSTTVAMPATYNTQWQKFVYVLVSPTQGTNQQYLTSSFDTSTGAVTINNSSSSAVTVSVSWMS